MGEVATPTPVTVIGGYLGAGKTTLVNHLLRNANGRRLAILVNEFGALPIDADLIETQDKDIIELSGGCVCCSYGNDLIMAMMDMEKMQPPPDHVILEASGVALPGAIASSLSLLNGFQVDGIVVLADAETVQERSNDKYMGDTIQRQLKDADIVLMNKSDLLPDVNTRLELRAWLATQAAGAAVIVTQNSKVPPEIILQPGLRVGLMQNETATVDHSPQSDHQTNHFTSNVVVPPEPVNPEEYAKGLIDENPTLVRAKGFVKSTTGALQTIQIVGKRFEISPAPFGVKPGIVLIRAG